MKVISEKRVLVLHIEYELKTEGLSGVFEHIDKKYGEHNCRCTRSGPKTKEGKVLGKGLAIVEVEQ